MLHIVAVRSGARVPIANSNLNAPVVYSLRWPTLCSRASMCPRHGSLLSLVVLLVRPVDTSTQTPGGFVLLSCRITASEQPQKPGNNPLQGARRWCRKRLDAPTSARLDARYPLPSLTSSPPSARRLPKPPHCVVARRPPVRQQGCVQRVCRETRPRSYAVRNQTEEEVLELLARPCCSRSIYWRDSHAARARKKCIVGDIGSP